MKAISLEFSIISTISLSLAQTLSLSHQDTSQVAYTYAPFQTIPTNGPSLSSLLNFRNSSLVAQSRPFPYTLHLTTESPPAHPSQLPQIPGSTVSRWVIHKRSLWRFTRSSSTYSSTIEHSSRSLNSITEECVGRSGCLGTCGALIAVGCYQRSYLRIGSGECRCVAFTSLYFTGFTHQVCPWSPCSMCLSLRERRRRSQLQHQPGYYTSIVVSSHVQEG